MLPLLAAPSSGPPAVPLRPLLRSAALAPNLAIARAFGATPAPQQSYESARGSADSIAPRVFAVQTRMPRLGKGRRQARLSAGMLVHSNQVGEGKEKLSKLAQQTKLPRQTWRREDQAVGLGRVMLAELEAFAVEDGVPAVDGIEAAI